ncbi:MAG: 3-dehydroquinate synthase [Lachnospiraceae bacterium]|nr:3-dehydroquinate synthase [Lachnospiraceae bacterium]
MTDRLCVHLDEKPIYDIVLEQSFDRLTEEVQKLGTEKKKLCIVADSNVAPLYLEEVKERLLPVCRQVDTFIFPAGEEQKNLNTVRDLYEALIRKAYDRNDMLVALGGGVTGDLCGFGAATYLRGISFIQIPTTLLSQVDSSIGGKTGVDFDAYKNMVGAFHMPKLVYTNVRTLATLSEEQFISGMGEVVKHGLIKNASYYHWLIDHAEAIMKRDYQICQQMILESNRIKRDVVELDPTEKGDRALLNFGHTLGHAIEKLKEFTMPHGHCVAVGFLAASEISARRGYLTREELNQLRAAMAAFHMPVTVDGVEADDVLEAVKHDKKMDAGTIKFILLKQMGDAYVDRTVSREEMAQGLACVLTDENAPVRQQGE